MKTSYWSRLRVLTWTVLLAAGSLASCSDDDDKDGPTPPPVQLEDQIEYDGGTPINIKSAIFEVEDTDLYTFYLSPTAGITDMDGMSGANDYLRVMVRNPKGTVDTETDTFEISYKDISVKEATMKDVKSVKLSADYLSETSRLNLYVEVEMESGKTLLARYENTCTEAELPVLNNQYELNGEAVTIGSALKREDPATGVTTYYFYNEADVTEPQDGLNGLTVTLTADVTETTFDLATVDPAQVSVKYGAFQNTENTTGSLTIEASNNGLTLAIDAEEGDNHLRAAYTGAFTFGYESRNYIKVTKDETPEEAALAKVFNYKKGSSNIVTFGMVDAEAPADLMEGNYAVSVSLTDSQLKEGSVDLSQLVLGQPAAQIRLFDYTLYQTWDNAKIGEGVTGTITAKQEGDKTYLKIEMAYPNGPKVECEWSGNLTTVTEETDMTPVKPFEPRLTLTNSSGTVTKEKALTRLELRREKEYSLRGGDPQYGGAIVDAYWFYFVTEDFSASDNIESRAAVPLFMIPAEYIGKEDIDLTVMNETLHWAFEYQNSSFLQYSSYSENYSMFGSVMGYCPEGAKATVIQNEDKTWKVTFSMTDRVKTTWGSSGYGSEVLLEWEGPATKYSGTKTNDLTDEDY
ncbi:hypothetical protein [uncultured Alistipes sp.]|uniref:hypothetical protein n=1 Tax=uncultured Alistipes sp. TaxID=538949 RepID=UPI0026205FE9|nr:hypothetical protein [uncultured Alistipes sp.]